MGHKKSRFNHVWKVKKVWFSEKWFSLREHHSVFPQLKNCVCLSVCLDICTTTTRGRSGSHPFFNSTFRSDQIKQREVYVKILPSVSGIWPEEQFQSQVFHWGFSFEHSALFVFLSHLRRLCVLWARGQAPLSSGPHSIEPLQFSPLWVLLSLLQRPAATVIFLNYLSQLQGLGAICYFHFSLQSLSSH